ncbi:hypothetical protein [Erythrobacter sp. YT30]|uniref:hypothetical protein n=1 Tax=Erythrobacter sp. YT30 TaxID=1735012 RepID=UPI00076CEA16|nr:hypothetical protein [Erythrobacter sp. YT30]KWV91732.1 hypothetical protein AUC45_11040 [Erythrobacter sp. YT30]
MLVLFSIFFLLSIVAALGIIKPYINGISRWQFAVGSIVSFFVSGIFAVLHDPVEEGDQPGRATEAEMATEKPDEPASQDVAATVASDAEKDANPKPKSSPAEKPQKPNKASGAKNNYADVSKQQYWIIQSHDAIKARLRDPSSAKFRNSRFYSGGGTPITCGEVNAKNAFGGFTGYERFIATGPVGDLAFIASDFAEGDNIDNVWNKLCVLAEGDEAYVP